MLHRLIKYVLNSLVQEKGKNITWINLLNSGIYSSISAVEFTKKQLLFWRHLLTASRDGSEKVRDKYYLNMFVKTMATIICIVAWYFLSKWFFTDFNPFSYMDLNGNFWNAIVVVGLPIVLYAFLIGQLDWFNTSDEHEIGTLIAESLPFKWLVSLEAGITEEITHRGVLIFFGLISVYFSNMFFVWIIGFFFLIFCIFFLAKLEIKFFPSSIILGIGALLFFLFRSHMPVNPIYTLNGYILDFLKWITAENIRLVVSVAALVIGSFVLTLIESDKKQDYTITPLELTLKIAIQTTWGIYCIPLGITTIANMPILPSGADHQTYLLYVGAILWSNAKFRDGHKYQGPYGMMSSYIFGLYMFYITFTYGLIYAIALHVLFDGILFSSEHLCQVIKDRDKMFCKNV